MLYWECEGVWKVKMSEKRLVLFEFRHLCYVLPFVLFLFGFVRTRICSRESKNMRQEKQDEEG